MWNSSTSYASASNGRSNGRGEGSIFCCIQCGSTNKCHHKGERAQMIWCMPNDVRTARELMTSSTEDREKVWADLIAKPSSTNYEINPEEPEFIEQCLAELNDELNKSIVGESSSSNDINTKKRGDEGGTTITPYEQALQMSPEYVTSRPFQLSFLRAERFHPKETAQRIQLHFEMKKELFCSKEGSDDDIDILGRDVTMEDLTIEEQTNFKSNNDGAGHFMRFLDEPDSAGRPILFGRASRMRFDKPLSELRIVYVLINTMAKDNEDFQKLGVVHIAHMLDKYPTHDEEPERSRKYSAAAAERPSSDAPTSAVNFDLMAKFLKLFGSSPMRFVSLYILADGGKAWGNVVDFCMYVMGRMMRLRCRVIAGSNQECKYNLMCLGYTPRNIPKELDEEDYTEDENRQIDAENSSKKRRIHIVED